MTSKAKIPEKHESTTPKTSKTSTMSDAIDVDDVVAVDDVVMMSFAYICLLIT